MKPDDKNLFIEGTMQICGQLEIEETLFACLETIRRVMPVDGIYLQFYDRTVDAMRIVAKATNAGGEKVDGLVPLPPEGTKTILSWIKSFATNKGPDALIYNTPETDPVCNAMLNYHGVGDKDSSLLIMLLGTKDAPFGSITVHAYDHNSFSEEHARYLALFKKPFTIAVSNARKHLEVLGLKELLADDNRYLRQEMRRISGDLIIGQEFGLKSVMEMVRHIAAHDSPVLLLGETGVGKDVIANAIHYASPRAKSPFITVNCGAIPSSLVDSELFGHEKGAFTGAFERRRGRFERANRGSIFLDEIGELTPEAQVKFLRVLQNKEIERVGGTDTLTVDSRVIAATNRNLEEMVDKQLFRQDLWFRLNVFPIMIPPLRERKDDIPALVDHFLKKKAIALKLRTTPELAMGAMEQLITYHWPGNVRELENVVERALILNKGEAIRFDTLGQQKPVGDNTAGMNQELLPSFEAYTSDYFKRVLIQSNGKINGANGAAALTGLNPSTLRNKLRKLGISFGK